MPPGMNIFNLNAIEVQNVHAGMKYVMYAGLLTVIYVIDRTKSMILIMENQTPSRCVIFLSGRPEQLIKNKPKHMLACEDRCCRRKFQIWHCFHPYKFHKLESQYD